MMEKKIITLLTDFGYADYYTAAVKGKIFSQLPDINIVDISHDVKTFNYREAAFILSNCYNFFPEGTIHIVGVNSEARQNTPHILVKCEGQYFICADNGILPIVLCDKDVEIYEIDYTRKSDVLTFPTMDVFAEIAILIASGGDYQQYLNKIDHYHNHYVMLQPIVGEQIQGHVLFVDSYRNLITNITKKIFYDFVKDSPFVIFVGSRSHTINKVSKTYSDVNTLDMLAIFGSHGYLEIALNRANAADLLGLSETITPTIVVELVRRF